MDKDQKIKDLKIECFDIDNQIKVLQQLYANKMQELGSLMGQSGEEEVKEAVKK